jgi:hypothetical protein
MSNFGEAERQSRKGEPQNKEWKVLANLGAIKKNKYDTLKITKVNFANKDLINFQIWRENTETGKTFPLKDQKLSINVEYKDQLIEALEKA